MLSSQPTKLTLTGKSWEEVGPQLIKNMNYLFNDIYNWIDTVRGIDNKTFEPENIELPAGTGIIGSDFVVSNYTERKTLDADNTTIHQIIDLLGTLIEALKSTT